MVDVGSGGDPHPRADVLVERFAFSGGERTTGFRRTAPTVVADIGALPFRESAFGYSICSHVLEHVADPVGAAEELSRVSLAGYVETPSGLHENLMPLGWHRWFVWPCEHTLVFEPKPSPFLDERLGEYFRSRWARDRAFMRLVWSHVDDLFIQHEWKGRLSVETTSPPAPWSIGADAEEKHEVADAPVTPISSAGSMGCSPFSVMDGVAERAWVRRWQPAACLPAPSRWDKSSAHRCARSHGASVIAPACVGRAPGAAIG